MFQDDQYVKAASHEAMGGENSIGVRIFVTPQFRIDKETHQWSQIEALSEEEERLISHACSDLVEKISYIRAKNDPKNIQAYADNKQRLLNCFPKDQPVFVQEIPNGYSSSYAYVDRPWLIVTTKRGPIKLGYRKRVLEIVWAESTVKKGAYALFPDENVTREGKLIHADSYEKATEYIKTILESE